MSNDDFRDPEVDIIRSHWHPPRPPATLDDAILATYLRQVGSKRRLRRVWLPILAALMFTSVAGVYFGIRWQQARQPQLKTVPVYVPVHQPRLIVISQGERP
jgi:hypothetical protein